MLSVCIPHYNYENPSLLNVLKKQCEKEKIEFEILIIDDASELNKKKYLKKFEEKPFRVIYLEKNIGRSVIRNLLAKEAIFDLILFLDADGKIENDDFIKNYLNNFEADIISGGRAYADLKPDKNHFLHYNYGFNVESKSHSFFHSNNFMIKKSVFEILKFDEQIKNYGYEDVVFGLEAKKIGLKMITIDNPVVHQDIKTNNNFLDDVDQALNNLLKIIDIKKELQIVDYVGISRKYKVLQRLGLNRFLSIRNHKITAGLRDDLILNPKQNSNLLLSIYKLYKYHQLKKLQSK
jgi:GT2 family glycosyltransferase